MTAPIEKYVLLGTATPLLNRGQWVTATDYEVGDVVYNLGASFSCKAQHTASATNMPDLAATGDSGGFVAGELANETPNGVLLTFTWDNVYEDDSETIYINGLAQVRTTDYTPTGSLKKVVFVAPPDIGAKIVASYVTASTYALAAIPSTCWEIFCAGVQGQRGSSGNPGTLTQQGTWVTGTYYALNDIVQHTESGHGIGSWICISAHTSGSTTEPVVGASYTDKWAPHATGGEDGVGTGTLVKSGSAVTDQLCAWADTGVAVKGAGAPVTVVNAVLVAETASTTAPVGTTDSLIVSENGTMKRKTADSFAQKYISVNIKAGAWIAATTDGCVIAVQVELVTNDANILSLGFVHTATKYATCDFELPEGYDGGAIYGYVTWYSTGTTSNGVRFGLQGRSIGDAESLDQAWGTAAEVTDAANGTANTRLRTAVIGPITLAGTPAPGETCFLRLYRSPTHGDDLLDESIYVLSVKVKIGINKHSE
jgi:hypothetical protein